MIRKIFILGGGSLQLDLILEAKRMFFYTIVLDADKDCIGSKWCDKFLHIDISNKEEVLKKAIKYKIDAILTSATEIGNVTACYVGEKLGLYTNRYQTSLNTTNKILMKEILKQHHIKTAKFEIYDSIKDDLSWDIFPCIVKPADSSAGRGVGYCSSKKELDKAIDMALNYSKSKKVLIEEYIAGDQYSIESISCNGKSQILAIDKEYINKVPYIMEKAHMIPADIEQELKKNIEKIAKKVLKTFDILYGASHIEVRVTSSKEIYIVEVASRTGGMRSEMINLAYGISFSQLLLLSSLNKLSDVKHSRNDKIRCNFIINYEAYLHYLELKQDKNTIIFEPFNIPLVNKDFMANNIAESKGYYFILEKT